MEARRKLMLTNCGGAASRPQPLACQQLSQDQALDTVHSLLARLTTEAALTPADQLQIISQLAAIVTAESPKINQVQFVHDILAQTQILSIAKTILSLTFSSTADPCYVMKVQIMRVLISLELGSGQQQRGQILMAGFLVQIRYIMEWYIKTDETQESELIEYCLWFFANMMAIDPRDSQTDREFSAKIAVEICSQTNLVSAMCQLADKVRV